MRTICIFMAFFVLLLGGISAYPADLSIMSFNIRYGSASDGPNSWDARKELVAETIQEYAPDVVGMQECLDFQAAYLAGELTEYNNFGIGRERNGKGEHMEILYKKDLLAPMEAGNYWLSELPNVPGSKSWNSSNVRMVTWIKFHHYPSREEFFYFNTHFDHRSEEARQEAAKLLAKDVLSRAGDSKAIITGDFNAVAESSVPWNTLIDAGLKDCWMVANQKKGPEITWSGFKAPELGRKRRIDWILLLGSIKCDLAETVTFNREGKYPSDHYPVFSRISW